MLIRLTGAHLYFHLLAPLTILFVAIIIMNTTFSYESQNVSEHIFPLQVILEKGEIFKLDSPYYKSLLTSYIATSPSCLVDSSLKLEVKCFPSIQINV